MDGDAPGGPDRAVARVLRARLRHPGAPRLQKARLLRQGALSNPDHYARQVDRLAEVFDDFTLDVYEERHHFDPPHRAEPARLARALWALWGRAAG